MDKLYKFPHFQLGPLKLPLAVLAAALGITVAMGVKAYMEEFIERNFIFFPSNAHTFAPREWGLEVEDVFFMTSDKVKLHAWYVHGPQNAPVVVWFHGNAGNISDRVENAKLLVDRGLSLFMVDYRGYGKSEGLASEKGIYIDGQSTYDHLVKEAGVPPNNLIIFGRSLGTCVAIYVAANNPCAGVILESAFTNMGDMATSFSILPGLGSFKHKFNSLGRIDKIRAPILFFHGDEDELVPYALGQKLYAAATSEKEFYTIKGAHHNDTYFFGGKRYFDKFESFVREKTAKEALP